MSAVARSAPNFASAPTTGSTPTPSPAGTNVSVDPSNKDEVASYIRYAAAQRGIDPETAVAVANSEGLNTYIGDYGSSFGPFQLHYGNVAAGGNAVRGLGDTFTAQTGLDARDPSTIRQQIDFALDQVKSGGWGPWHGAARVGIGPRQGIGTFTGDAAQFAGKWGQQAVQAIEDAGTAAVNTVSDAARSIAARTSQFAMGLSSGDALAFCGPAAAMAFAQTYGRNPTVAEAKALAVKVGWNSQQGMAGIDSERRLLSGLGVETYATEGVNWNDVAGQVQNGNPVIIDTPGHYYYIDGYDAKTSQFHVGTSGTDLKGGGEFMTPQRINAMPQSHGPARGALFISHPNTEVGVGNAGMGAGQEGPTMSKLDAAYRTRADTRNCRDCTMFRQPGTCTLVKGDIAPGGTCKHFEAKKVGAGQGEAPPWQRAAEFVQGIPGAIQHDVGPVVQNIRNAVADTVRPAVQEQMNPPQPTPTPTPTPAPTPPPEPVPTATSEAAQQPQEQPSGIEQLPVIGGIAQGLKDFYSEDAWRARSGLPPRSEEPVLTPEQQKEAEDARMLTTLSGLAAPDWMPASVITDPQRGMPLTVKEAQQREQQRAHEGAQAGAIAASFAVPMAGASLGSTMALGAAGAATAQAPDIVDALASGDPERIVNQAVGVAAGAALAPAAPLVSRAAFAVGSRLPAPVGLLGQGVGRVLQGLRAPGEWVANRAEAAVTGGSLTGLDRAVLDRVGVDLRNPVPNAQVAQMFTDASGMARGPRGGATVISRRLDREARLLSGPGAADAPMTGEEVMHVFHNLAPGQADTVLTNHNLQSLTSDYFLGHMAQQGLVPATIPHAARVLTNTLGGGAAGAVGAALTDLNANPSDPEWQRRVLMGSMAGMALMNGNPYITGWFSKDVLPSVLNHWNAINNPIKNLNASNTIGIASNWMAQKQVLRQVYRANLLEAIQRTWGGPGRYEEVAKTLERTGQLPVDLQRNPDAMAAWQLLKDTWDLAVKQRVADDVLKHAPQINPGQPGGYFAQFAIHHVPKKEWLVARNAALLGESPQALEEAARGAPRIINQPGISHFNVLSHAVKERKYANFEEGEALAGAEYDYSNLPELLADQFDSQLQAMLNKNLASQLRGLREDVTRLPVGTRLFDHDVVSVPRDLGIAPAGLDSFVTADSQGLGSVFGRPPRNSDIYISKPLAEYLKSAFAETGLFANDPRLRSVVSNALKLNSVGKDMILGGPGFHLWNEILAFTASNGMGSFPELARIAQTSFTKGGFNKFVANNMDDIVKYVAQGGTWNILPETRLINLTRGLMYSATTAGAATAVYGYSKATGATDDEARKKAAIAAILAGAVNAPVGFFKTRQWTSFNTYFSDMLFTRVIPMMKLITWQLHNKTPEAAEWTTEAFGGENLQMLLRSRSVTDMTRLAFLAPDWTGSFLRQVGGALIDNSSKGSLNRGYWAAAAANAAMMVEGLNLLLAGHPSWQNPPGQEGTVDLTPFFDRRGWKHTQPGSGEPAGVYMDIVPTWRGLVEPYKETARWGLSALAQTDLGQQMHLDNPAITGGLKPGQPGRPDPASEWGKYLSGRSGLIGSTVGEFTDQADFTGRPIDRSDDPLWAVAGNRALRALTRLAQSDITPAMRDVVRGGPTPLAVGTALTGLRPVRTTKYAEAQEKRQFEIEHGTTTQPWRGPNIVEQQQARARRDSYNSSVADKRSQVLSDPALTPAERTDKMKGAAYQFQPLPDFEASMVPPEIQDKHPEVIQRFKNDMLALDAIRGDASGQQQADYIGSPSSGLDPEALFNEAWNRDATQLSQARTDQDRAALRRLWLTQAAEAHGIDHDVLEDLVKARLFYGPTGKLDPLPGMSSANLNTVREAYEAAGNSTDNVDAARFMQSKVIADYAKVFGVDAGNLQRRIHLRTVAPKEQTPADQARARALTVLEDTHNFTTSPAYMNADGTPMGEPKDWIRWDAQLASQDNWDKFKGMYISREMEERAQAKARGQVNAQKIAFQSKGYWDYEREFGIGRQMRDDQWAKFRAGTLDMWRDSPTPEVARERNDVMALYRALTPDQRFRTSVTMSFYGVKWPDMTVDGAIKNLNKIRSNAWKEGNIGLLKNITDADAPPDADLSLVAPAGGAP